MKLPRKQTGSFLLLLLLLFAASRGFGQSKGFILQQGSDSRREGFITFDYQHPEKVGFGFQRQGSPRTYAVGELPGFGLNNGTVYVAKTIALEGKPQRLFIEMMGDSAFFYLRRDNLYFKGTDFTTPLTPQELLPYLQSLTSPSSGWYKQLHLVRLQRNALRYFARNQQAGKSPTISVVSGGIFTSFNRSTLSTSDAVYGTLQSAPMEASSQNISAGIFADLPVWPVNNLSVRAQGSYGKMRFTGTEVAPPKRYDLQVNLDFIRLSLMPQYTLSLAKVRLFAQAGPSVLYPLKSESQAVSAATQGDIVQLYFGPGVSVGKGPMLGFEAGAGFSFYYLPRHFVSVAVSQASNSGKKFNISNQSLTISTNL